MKKILKIVGILFVLLLVALIVLPIVFQDKIKEFLLAEANKNLNAKVHFESATLSLWKNFPQLSVGIQGLRLSGVGDFAKDTLLSADEISLTVNLRSLLGSDGYEISSVFINRANINAIVLEDGRPNWDILKPSETPEAPVAAVKESAPEAPLDFKLQLKKLAIEQTNIVYDDRQGKIFAGVGNLNVNASGDMTAANTLLKLKTEIEKLTFKYEDTAYLNEAKTSLTMEVDADLAKNKFTFKDNEFNLNAISLGFEGFFALLDNESYDMDIKLKTGKLDFKELLSMVPAVYAKDFESLKATGEVSLQAWAKGKMTQALLPTFEVVLSVKDGSLRYPSLPKGLDNIQLSVSAQNPGGTVDETIVEVNPLQFGLGGNPFSLQLHLATPISDPAFDIKANGTLDLRMVREVFPMDAMDALNGVLSANLALKGKLSQVEKEQYEQLNASGSLKLSNMTVKMKDMPHVNIQQSTLAFTPQYLNLSETHVKIGKSDISVDSRLENYIAFALRGKTIRGKLNIKSNLLDLNELVGQPAPPSQPAQATPPAASGAANTMTAVEVPKNVDFEMNTSLKKLLFDNLVLENVAGQVGIHAGKLDLKNLSFNALGGSIVANGSYSTAANPKSPDFNAGFKMSQISFAESFRTFVTVQKMAPIFQDLKGNFSGNLQINSKLDNTMTPLFNSMNGEGSIATSNVNLSNIKVVGMIADALKNPQLKNTSVKDLKINFQIQGGRVYTQPFTLSMGSTNMVLSGSTGVDQTIDYTGKINLPAAVGSKAGLSNVEMKIAGTFDSPKVSVDTKGMLQQATKALANEALGKLGEKLGVDLSNAQQQKEALVKEAQKAGDKLKAEAKAQADALVKKAGKNPLAVTTAKKAGDTLIKEANKQADALVAKANSDGDKLIEKAKLGQ